MSANCLRVLPTPPATRSLRAPARIEAAIARLARGVADGGPIRAALRRLARHGARDPATGVRVAIAPTRRRRAERVAHLGNLLQVLVRLADLGSGRIGRPAGRHWAYLPASVLDTYAFGALVPGERSQARTDRALRDLEAAGWLRVIERPDRQPDGAYRARAAVRLLTRRALDVLGLRLTGAARDEQLAAARLGERLARVAGFRPRRTAAEPPSLAPAAAPVRAPDPAARAGPTETGRAALDALAAMLGLRR